MQPRPRRNCPFQVVQRSGKSARRYEGEAGLIPHRNRSVPNQIGVSRQGIFTPTCLRKKRAASRIHSVPLTEFITYCNRYVPLTESILYRNGSLPLAELIPYRLPNSLRTVGPNHSVPRPLRTRNRIHSVPQPLRTVSQIQSVSVTEIIPYR